MPRTNLEFAQETNRWKNYISDMDSIPFSDTHIYKNYNDFYERLTQHVKCWIESEFGYFENVYGEMQGLADVERTQESKDLSIEVGSLLTPPRAKWYSAALSGNKKTKISCHIIRTIT